MKENFKKQGVFLKKNERAEMNNKILKIKKFKKIVNKIKKK